MFAYVSNCQTFYYSSIVFIRDVLSSEPMLTYHVDFHHYTTTNFRFYKPNGVVCRGKRHKQDRHRR